MLRFQMNPYYVESNTSFISSSYLEGIVYWYGIVFLKHNITNFFRNLQSPYEFEPIISVLQDSNKLKRIFL